MVDAADTVLLKEPVGEQQNGATDSVLTPTSKSLQSFKSGCTDFQVTGELKTLTKTKKSPAVGKWEGRDCGQGKISA